LLALPHLLSVATAAPPAKAPRDATTARLFNGKVAVVRAPQRPGSTSADQAMKGLFGRVLSDHEIAALVGAPDGAAIRVQGAEHLDSSWGGGHVAVRVDHRFCDAPHHHIFQGKLGDVTSYLGLLSIKQDRRVAPKGLGARVTAHMAAAARELGLRKVALSASPYGTLMLVGRQVWPKLGFDFPYEGATYQRRLKLDPATAERWQKRSWDQLMQIRLTRRSFSLRVHDQYLVDRGILVDVHQAYGI